MASSQGVYRSAGRCLHRHFQMSLLQSVAPICFKKTTIVPVPKKSRVFCLNHYRPVALTSNIIQHHEVLLAVSQNFHHLLPLWLTGPTSVCLRANWWHHLPSPPYCPLPPGQEGHMWECCSLATVQHLTPLCPPSSLLSSETGDDETAYREEVRALTSWCQDNNLHLNVSKNKGADWGLWEATGRRTRPTLHQWDYSGESPHGSHQQGPDPDSPHRHHHNDSQTTALVPPQAAEDQRGLQDTLQLLQVHHSILTGCVTIWSILSLYSG